MNPIQNELFAVDLPERGFDGVMESLLSIDKQRQDLMVPETTKRR